MLVPILVLQVATATPDSTSTAVPPVATQSAPVPPLTAPTAPAAVPAAPPSPIASSVQPVAYPPQGPAPTAAYPPPLYAPPPGANREQAATWFARFSIGADFLFSTEQVRLLREDGYALKSRIWLQADGAWLASKYVGIGGFAVMGGTSWEPKQGGPSLSDDVYMAGAQVPIVLGTDSLWFVISPRAGVGWGYLGFSSSPKAMVAPALGADFSLLLRKQHVGLTTGVISAPTRSHGDLGRHYDLGGYYVLLTGVIDG